MINLRKIANKYTLPIIKYYLSHPFTLIFNRFIVSKLFLRKYVKRDINFLANIKSEIPIDIVLCAVDKDYEVLIHAIDSIRKNIKHPIGNIFLICPISDRIKKIAKEKSCVLLDENKVLPITKKDIRYTVNGQNRSGWLFQQLLKWGADKFVTNEHFLITDADTIYCRPQKFIHKNRVLLPVSGQLCHIPYFAAIQRLTGYKVKPIINVTIHHSLFEKKKLHEIKRIIENRHKTKWYQAIIDNLDHHEGASVSDYETYGQIALIKYKDEFSLEYAFNRGYKRGLLNQLDIIIKKNRSSHKNISFHSYDD